MSSHHDPELLPFGAFRPIGGRLRLFKKDTEAPDYKPLAKASKETAEIMAALSREQLDFAKTQYAEMKPILTGIADSQIAMQDETRAQGKDYYDYMVANQRPVEDALNKDAMAAGSEAEQERAAGLAGADARQGTTAMQNQSMRQGLRYGFSPEKMKAMSNSIAAQQGLGVANAMNQGRSKEKALGYAKKMDVAGLYRGLAGASQGAYGMALNAGNAAGQNMQSPGQNYQAGLGQGAHTMAQGRSMYQQGLGTVLNSQTQMALGDDSGAAAGSAIGAAGSMAAAFI